MSLSQHFASGEPNAKVASAAFGERSSQLTKHRARRVFNLRSSRRRRVGIHVRHPAPAARCGEDACAAGLAGPARDVGYPGYGAGHLRTRGRNGSVEGDCADSTQVRGTKCATVLYLFKYFK
jgi:hypothetical protein